MLSRTQIELSEELGGREGGEEALQWECRGVGGKLPSEGQKGRGRGPVCRKGSDLRMNGLIEPRIRGGCVDGNKAH